MKSPTVEQFMTKSPHTIGQEQSLAVAHQLMNKHAIRHLPVLHGGKLVGMVSQRDLLFVETLKDVDPEKVTVSEAMTPDAFTVTPTTSVRSIVAEMIDGKFGSAVITDHDHVVGVFTTVDALRALVSVLDEK